jgi:hypothetical protein
VLLTTWDAYRSDLEAAYPSVQALSTMSWDQALGDMALEYIGAFKAHVLTHLSKRLAAYVMATLDDWGVTWSTAMEDGMSRSVGYLDGFRFYAADVYSRLERLAASAAPLPPRVERLVCDLRGAEGLGIPDGRTTRVSAITRITNRVFRLHVRMSRSAEDAADEARAAADVASKKPSAMRPRKTFSCCPVIQVGRTFAFIDERVAEALAFRAPGAVVGRPAELSTLEKLLRVDRASWNAANKAARANAVPMPRGGIRRSGVALGTSPRTPRGEQRQSSLTAWQSA